MNWLKVVTQAGRQSIVDELLQKELTQENCAIYAAKGVSAALDAGTARLSDERIKQIAEGCEAGGKLCAQLGRAINPDSEDGKKISEAEKQGIMVEIRPTIVGLISQDVLDDLRKKIVAKVP